jgi:hypothetical protein
VLTKAFAKTLKVSEARNAETPVAALVYAPSRSPSAGSASRVCKPRSNAALVRSCPSGVRRPSAKRSESRRKSSTGASAIALTVKTLANVLSAHLVYGLATAAAMATGLITP